MFYRIKENRVYDYADYKYEDDCLELENCDIEEFDNNRIMYVIKDDKLVINPDYVLHKSTEQEEEFKKQFFHTSLGWIKRKVTMKDGSVRDFLSDLLLHIKAGLELGQSVEIIAYKTPDFTKEYTQEYMISLQEHKNATLEFIQECLMQTVMDFGG